MTTIASYPNTILAQQAYDTLMSSGIDKDNVSVASRQPEQTSEVTGMDVHKDSDVIRDATGGTASGAMTGAAVGFLVGAAALAIPGFGPLLISGPLAAAFGGSSLAANTAVGAAIGGVSGLVSGLVKSGVDETQAKQIESNLQQGGVMIAVKDDAAGTYRQVLEKTNPSSPVALND